MANPRCYDCGQEVDPRDVRRRDVVVSRDTSGGTLSLGGHFGHVAQAGCRLERVDLCLECDRERDRQQNSKERALARSVQQVLVTLLVTIAVCLPAAAVVVLLVLAFRK